MGLPSFSNLIAQQVDSIIPFNLFELAIIGLYLVSLVGIGVLGFRARKENTLRDFYLAGNGVGFIVLVFTLYATQYSGNTLFAFSGKTVRIGLAWIMCLHFMTAIVIFYLLLAPKLYPLSRSNTFITPADYVQHRYANRWLTVLIAVVMIVAIANFLVAQLMAMGRALQGITSYDPDVAFIVGVIVLAAIVLIYETLGGFRAVAWTDAIQGAVLMLGFLLLMGMVWQSYGSPAEAVAKIKADDHPRDPSTVLNVPHLGRCVEWLSYILIVGIGGALYPQAIQRIYAAKSLSTLKLSLIVMGFLPLLTTLIVVLVGLYGIAFHPEVGVDASSDTILTVICRQVQESSLLGRILVTVIFAAIFAALMSTADSVLLSMSSMFTKDIYGGVIDREATQKRLTMVGKLFSVGLIGLAVFAAIQLRQHQTLVGLLDRKFDLLVQVAPAFLLGLHWKKTDGRAVLVGLIAGLVVAVGIAIVFGKQKPLNIHPGIFGLLVNFLVTVGGTMILSSRKQKLSR